MNDQDDKIMEANQEDCNDRYEIFDQGDDPKADLKGSLLNIEDVIQQEIDHLDHHGEINLRLQTDTAYFSE